MGAAIEGAMNVEVYVELLKRTSTPVPRIEQHGFGVFGPNGALPLHLTEVAYSREHQADDPAFSDFVNAFQHRFASLFYRAWAGADPSAVNASWLYVWHPLTVAPS